jgi:hypothetical protein
MVVELLHEAMALLLGGPCSDLVPRAFLPAGWALLFAPLLFAILSSLAWVLSSLALQAVTDTNCIPLAERAFSIRSFGHR